MIEERVNNEMALILHVIPLNQDTDTISTWRLVHGADEAHTRTVTILTKADLALKDGKDVFKKRLKKILKDSKSAECFVVHGAATNSESEEIELAAVKDYIEELQFGHIVKVGIKELNNFIEERMSEHILDKFPEMRFFLYDELHKCEKELETVGRDPLNPLDIALNDIGNIKELLRESFGSLKIFKN